MRSSENDRRWLWMPEFPAPKEGTVMTDFIVPSLRMNDAVHRATRT
jgi:hypothetical protein